MNKKMLTAIILLMCYAVFEAIGQGNIRNYQYKSGEVLDILVLNLKPSSSSLAKIYFNEAISIAIQNGYRPIKDFTIKNYPLQGNYHQNQWLWHHGPVEK